MKIKIEYPLTSIKLFPVGVSLGLLEDDVVPPCCIDNPDPSHWCLTYGRYWGVGIVLGFVAIYVGVVRYE